MTGNLNDALDLSIVKYPDIVCLWLDIIAPIDRSLIVRVEICISRYEY